MPETGGVMAVKRFRFKPGRKYYKIKRVVIYADGNHEIMTNTKPFFNELRKDTALIANILRIRAFERLFK
jgi:hypothetical protein